MATTLTVEPENRIGVRQEDRVAVAACQIVDRLIELAGVFLKRKRGAEVLGSYLLAVERTRPVTLYNSVGEYRCLHLAD